MKLSIITGGRADEGNYLPLLKALDKADIPYVFSNKFYKADWLVVIGDTWPMIEAVIEAAKLNIPIAHIHGGDLTGSIDDSIRHAISKFAHIHFPTLPEHAERLKRMGEEEWRIHIIGPLGIYAMPEVSFIPKHEIRRNLGLEPGKPIIIVIQHPVSTEREQAGQQMRETLEAVNNPDWQPVVFYPNSELGREDMIKVIRSYPYAKFENLPYLQFISLLKVSSCIVGNSSCGLVEAPLFGVPCVDIGSRQDGRLDGNNSIYAFYVAQDIKEKITMMMKWCKPAPSVNPYSGYSGGPEKIIKVLRETPIDKRLLEKRNTY